MKRKIMIFALLVALLITSIIPTVASDETNMKGVAVTNSVGAPGNQVKVTVSMSSKFVDYLGLVISYDTDVLTMDSEASAWLLDEEDGVGLQDVRTDSVTGKGIAVMQIEAGDVSGDVFEIVFDVAKEAQADAETVVECTLVGQYKNSEEIRATASGTVTIKNLAIVSGSLASSGSAKDPIKVEVLNSASEVVDSVLVENAADGYEFELEPGVYTIRVSKTMHCPREFEVSTEDMTNKVVDAEIKLYGDIYEDGRINAFDARSVLQKSLNMTTEVWDDYKTEMADVNADGRVNAFDAREILKKSLNMESVFDEME